MKRRERFFITKDTDFFHSAVLRSLGTGSGSSPPTGCTCHRSYTGLGCTGLLASLFLIDNEKTIENIYVKGIRFFGVFFFHVIAQSTNTNKQREHAAGNSTKKHSTLYILQHALT